MRHLNKKKKDFWLLLPSVSDAGIFFEGGTEGGELLGTTLQHVVLHVCLEGAVKVLKGIHFIQGEHLEYKNSP